MYKKVICLLVSFFLTFVLLSSRSRALEFQPNYIPCSVNIDFWDATQVQQISQAVVDQNFIIQLNLSGGNGVYDIYLDFGDGMPMLVEKDFIGYTFRTSYNYHTSGYKTVSCTVVSMNTAEDSQTIYIKPQ